MDIYVIKNIKCNPKLEYVQLIRTLSYDFSDNLNNSKTSENFMKYINKNILQKLKNDFYTINSYELIIPSKYI